MCVMFSHSDIPDGAENGDLHPDTPMRVELVGETETVVTSLPIKDVLPGACRHWKGTAPCPTEPI
jgi:hypothetical protein